MNSGAIDVYRRRFVTRSSVFFIEKSKNHWILELCRFSDIKFIAKKI
jgi:hypothetical protein